MERADIASDAGPFHNIMIWCCCSVAFDLCLKIILPWFNTAPRAMDKRAQSELNIIERKGRADIVIASAAKQSETPL